MPALAPANDNDPDTVIRDALDKALASLARYADPGRRRIAEETLVEISEALDYEPLYDAMRRKGWM